MDSLPDKDSPIPRWQAAERDPDIRPGNSEQNIIEACCRFDRGCGCTLPERGDLSGKSVWTALAAQRHFVASRERVPCERQRDRAGADCSELHDAAPKLCE